MTGKRGGSSTDPPAPGDFARALYSFRMDGRKKEFPPGTIVKVIATEPDRVRGVTLFRVAIGVKSIVGYTVLFAYELQRLTPLELLAEASPDDGD